MAALIRAVEAAGGFATVLQSGERDAGTILILTTERGENARVHERMPSPDGDRRWTVTHTQVADNAAKIDDYLSRRKAQDADLWIIELDIANGERFIGLTDGSG